MSIDQFYEAVNISQPSFIRVEADEVTYPMHVILRYEIEKGLFDGSIEVNGLPDLWNSKMKEYLGVEPPTNTLGVLQDTHWSGGAFGYFPSYTLGAIYASQFYQTFIKGRFGEFTSLAYTGSSVVPLPVGKQTLPGPKLGSRLSSLKLLNYAICFQVLRNFA